MYDPHVGIGPYGDRSSATTTGKRKSSACYFLQDLFYVRIFFAVAPTTNRLEYTSDRHPRYVITIK